MRLRRPKTSLVDRLRPYVDAGPPTEPMVSADPIRMFLYRWMIETGDPIEVVAKGFDIDGREASALALGECRWISRSDARRLYDSLGLWDVER